jgi:hypothetical protein
LYDTHSPEDGRTIKVVCDTFWLTEIRGHAKFYTVTSFQKYLFHMRGVGGQEVAGSWRGLNNEEEFHNFYSSP